MKALKVLDRLLGRIELAFLVVFLSTMILLSFSQVILRNFLGTGFVWADTIIRHLVVWVGFTGAALAAIEERHIHIDALTKFLSERTTHMVKVATYLFAAVVCYYLGDAALRFLLDEKQSGSELVLSIPTWAALTVIPVGYGLLAFHFVVKVIEHAANLVRPARVPN
jgi:C4-dicarboxylate transporter DctQ subunit